MRRELTSAELRWCCPDEWVPWASSEELEPANSIVGQERAVEAIAFGLTMRGVGYNIFVTGLSGTGRLTTIKTFLDRLADGDAAPDDVCFVQNFRQPDEPRALQLCAGGGRRLETGMEQLVENLAEGLEGLFTGEEFRHRVDAALGELQSAERTAVEELEGQVKDAGFALVQVEAEGFVRPEVLPLVDGKPVALDELRSVEDGGTLDAARVAELHERHDELVGRLQDVFRNVTKLRRRMKTRVEEVRREAVAPMLDLAVEHLRAEVADARVDGWLEQVRQDLEEHLELFAVSDEGAGDRFLRWRVNVAVDNSGARGRPVVLETEPTYSNLFGTIERFLRETGEPATDFTRVQAGSLLRANGGFLVLAADDMLRDERVWPALKRALKYRRARIQAPENVMLGTSALKPAPVPLDVKVVVIGDRTTYDLLFRWDVDFSKVFKVLADFDTVLERSVENAREVLSVLRKVGLEERLIPLARSGMAAMLEVAVRQGRSRRRFSSRFSDLADVLREASHWTESDGSAIVGREYVAAAVAAHRRRHGLWEDRTHQLITDGVVRIAISGTAVGQVNGLAVYDLGHTRFGKPSRITARVGVGRAGVVDVERRSGLSGPTHDKGVSILTGFLRGTFDRTPLAMTCSITFEQSYGGIDGDSASSTEVYAILSALAELPLLQGVAVTGSVDQYGNIQPIGGVNEKVEGFFRVCQELGLDGAQGVMVPTANVADLQLAAEVTEAVAAGSFHVWAVDTVEDGIELLAGIPAGERSDDGSWTPGSVYDRCHHRLEELNRLQRQARGALEIVAEDPSGV